MRSPTEHYLLMKHPGFTKSGQHLSANECAKALLNVGLWPLYENTPCKLLVRPKQKILIYLAGKEKEAQQVIASVTISKIEPWSKRKHATTYPLLMEDIPSIVLHFDHIDIFDRPIDIREHLKVLDLTPKNIKRWGCALIGGMRQVTPHDFNILSGNVSS